MEDVQLGSRYLIEGYPATVVAVAATGEFADGYTAAEWADVVITGILVRDDQAGLIHYPDLGDIRIEPLRS